MLPEYIGRHVVHLSRPLKQTLMVLGDIVLLTFCVWASYALRFGEWFVPNREQTFLMLIAPLIALPIFLKAGLYRSVIRYMGEHALWSIIKGMTLAALIWAVLAFMTQMTGASGVPRAVPLLYWLLGVVFVGGARFTARWMLWLPVRERFAGRQVLIYGAGDAGRQLAATLRQGRGFFPAGFLDDNGALQGKDVGGLRVYAPSQLPYLTEQFDIHDVIVTLPRVSHVRRKEILAYLEQFPVRVRVLPALSDIANGRHLVNMLREVDIGDLLGRDAVVADPALLNKCIRDKVVLITGAGGSIGSELCRQVAALRPKQLLMLDANEFALYQIDRIIRSIADFEVHAYLGSVEDYATMKSLLARHGVQTIYHAAAHKHVPLVESNVVEGARNNTMGTYSLAKAAFTAGVETFLLISTDKAVRPTNVMGATKRWAELIVQDFASRASRAGTRQHFSAVRFGNVLGSSGSVIPLFKEQIAQGGPVTVTHAEVTRYFMSIHEAVELVIQASSMATGGEVFLLDMGEPVKILDLAHKMIRMAGQTERSPATPDGDIEIVVTGLRPGEKLYEELLISDQNARPTPHPKIKMASEHALESASLEEYLQRLSELIRDQDSQQIRHLLMSVAINPPTSCAN
ncbi:polysaccharide biosynthesis protein [Achromobacter pulmonis]|uniref:polysaccharide biosynthesis protein n=1 Tax=Achromobacter pulmonis TaxID=1389932 RepID=UPI001F400B96|nr:nucleoside-diphosphate sugar epimerase/dehydratase [Achromobacter pulmonis]MCF7767862.1 polysaccharide biosynthesis protein [Achromobacter pulmonis]